MRARLAIVGIILVIIAGVLVLAYHSNSPSASTNPDTNTNSTTQGTTFDENALLDRGVTSQQLNSLEQVLGQYLASQGRTASQVDFSSIYRMPTNPKISTPFSEITFMVQLDGKSAYKAKMDSFGTSEIRLYLYTLDGKKLLYDSQNVGGPSGQ